MNFGNLGTSIFATGLGMTLLNKFGDIWKTIKNFAKIGYSIYASTETGYTEYSVLNKYILSLNSSAVNKRTTYDAAVFYDDSNEKAQAIGVGTYCINTSFMQFMIVNIERIVRQNIDNPNHSITITIYGLHAKEKYNEIKSIISKALSTNTQHIIGAGYYADIKKRTFDNIYHQKKNEIIEFLDNFKKSKSLYDKNGVTYKTGILLYGPPGTGKTSMIRAIAAYMNYWIEIANFTNDNQITCDQITRPSTVIVFEELDKIINSDNTITNPISNTCKKIDPLRTIMQSLDGLNSREDVIYVATTNNIDALPEQLIRDGRFDLKVELGNIDKENAIAMCNSFNMNLEDVIPSDQEFPINPSYLQNLILNKINRKRDIKLT